MMAQVAPLVFVDDTFALKGGSAINLFVRDMPRLSVDLDLVFPDCHASTRWRASMKRSGKPPRDSFGVDFTCTFQKRRRAKRSCWFAATGSRSRLKSTS
jgi:Nucleotidyl transferase AbiEii toxin, Type IV TA system